MEPHTGLPVVGRLISRCSEQAESGLRRARGETAQVDKVAKIVRENVAKEKPPAHDTSRVYTNVGREYDQETVNHFAKEFARGDVTTNSIEGFFSIFKRGMKGVYQHCDERHLHRYLNELDFRYNKTARRLA